jgi:hypothetical protein
MKKIALEIQNYFAVGGTPQQFDKDTEFVAAKIREAVNAEREACAEIAETDSILDWVGGSTGNAKGTAIRIACAIRARNEKAV